MYVNQAGKLLNYLSNRLTNTPDFVDLNHKKAIPLFVYGRCMTGHTFNYLLSNSAFLGAATTVGHNYRIQQMNGYVPMMYETGKLSNDSYALVGECYLVDALVINKLDSMLVQVAGNNGRFFRKHVACWLKNQPEQNKILKNVECYFCPEPLKSNEREGHMLNHLTYQVNTKYKYKMWV